VTTDGICEIETVFETNAMFWVKRHQITTFSEMLCGIARHTIQTDVCIDLIEEDSVSYKT